MAYLDLPKANGDGSSRGETFNDRAGDEVQQEPWPAKGNAELVSTLPRPRAHGWMWAGRGGTGGFGARGLGASMPLLGWSGEQKREG